MEDQEDQDGLYLGKKYNAYPDSSSAKEHIKSYLLNVLKGTESDNFSQVYQVDKNIAEIIDKLEVTFFDDERNVVDKTTFNRQNHHAIIILIKFNSFVFACQINLNNISSCNLFPLFLHEWDNKDDGLTSKQIPIYYTTNHWRMESCHAFDKLICSDSTLQPMFVQKLYQYVRNMYNGKENGDMGDYRTSANILYDHIKDGDPSSNRVLHKLTYNEIKSQLDIIYDSSFDEETFVKVKSEIGHEFENDETLKSFIKLMLTNVCFCIHHIYHPYNY